MLLRVSAVLLFAATLSRPARAADAGNPEEDRLRATLKATMAQLQSAQDQLATLQATQTSLTDQNKTLTAKYEVLRKQAEADQATADKTATELRSEAAAQKASIAQLQDALEQARADDAGALQALRNTQNWGARTTLVNQALQRRVSDLESKNLALFLLGNEILTRYQNFSFGTALAAKEPFVGRSRTKLENLVQEYQDKLLDQRAH